jgi:hypothetical protein
VWGKGEKKIKEKKETRGTQKGKKKTQKRNITFFVDKSINVNILCFGCQISLLWEGKRSVKDCYIFS